MFGAATKTARGQTPAPGAVAWQDIERAGEEKRRRARTHAAAGRSAEAPAR